MQYHFFALTDTGRTRDNNEDSVTFDAASGLAILADGMGGYNAGEIASGMATTFLKSELGRWLAQAGDAVPNQDVLRAMEICVDNANLAVFNAANSNPQYEGMGTTLVLTVFRQKRLLVGHIGDSRCYRLRQDALVQLTRDHSLLQEQIDAGLVTPAEAAHSNIRNLVTRALGVEAAVELESSAFDVLPGDRYLLCSDGLSDMVDDPTIARILGAQRDLSSVATQLIDAANANGGRDNISALLVDAYEAVLKPGLMARWFGR